MLLGGAEAEAQVVSLLTAFTTSEGTFVSESWRDLFPVLLTTYRDGYVMKNLDQPTIAFDRMFYPRWWLEQVGYFEIGGNKDGILFSSNPNSLGYGLRYFVHTLLVLVGALLVGYAGYRVGVSKQAKAEYGENTFAIYRGSSTTTGSRSSSAKHQLPHFSYAAIPEAKC